MASMASYWSFLGDLESCLEHLWSGDLKLATPRMAAMPSMRSQSEFGSVVRIRSVPPTGIWTEIKTCENASWTNESRKNSWNGVFIENDFVGIQNGSGSSGSGVETYGHPFYVCHFDDGCCFDDTLCWETCGIRQIGRVRDFHLCEICQDPGRIC